MDISELQSNFANELVNQNSDLIQDWLEVGIDSIFEDEILEAIPAIKTIVGVAKTGLLIKERYFAKKLMKFIIEFNSGEINEDDLIKFKKDMKSSESYQKKTTEQLIITLDRLEEIQKTSCICKLFIGYIEKKISWEKFVSFSQYVSFMTKKDFDLLRYLKGSISGTRLNKSEKNTLEYSEYNGNRLMHFGFVGTKSVTGSYYGGVAPVTTTYLLTEDGVIFLDCFKQ